MSDQKTNKYSSLKEGLFALFLVSIILFLWVLSWFLIDNYILSSDLNKLSNEETRGVFGDKFGAINSIFSGLAFAGIIFTILLQRKELSLQRDELKSTRDVFEKQNEMLSQEKFENTFFQLLNLYSSIVNSLDLRRKRSSSEVISTGRDCFENFYTTLKSNLVDQNQRAIEFSVANSTIKQVIDAYGKFYNTNKSDMSHYFRTLYHIIKFVDQSNVANPKQYTAIVRAQLSSYEQVLLFYNCLHQNGKEKFKPLIEKYTLFKNLDTSLIFNQQHLNEYEDNAYKYKN